MGSPRPQQPVSANAVQLPAPDPCHGGGELWGVQVCIQGERLHQSGERISAYKTNYRQTTNCQHKDQPDDQQAQEHQPLDQQPLDQQTQDHHPWQQRSSACATAGISHEHSCCSCYVWAFQIDSA